jgi:hypothetical protein
MADYWLPPNRVNRLLWERAARLEAQIQKYQRSPEATAERFAAPLGDTGISVVETYAARAGEPSDSLMAIPFVLTSYQGGAPDRDGDVVLPQGRYGKNYDDNPIWCWSHDPHSRPRWARPGPRTPAWWMSP